MLNPLRCSYTLGISAAVALLAGCGGSQPPIGALGAMPQTSAIATVGKTSGSGDTYLYMWEYGLGDIAVLTYPAGKEARAFRDTGWLCSDPNTGDLYVSTGARLQEYSPGASSKIADVQLPSGYEGQGCAVDPATHSIAVVGSEAQGSTKEASVLVYPTIDESPSVYTDPNEQYFAFGGYDNQSNLFVDGYTSFAELPSGQGEFTEVNLGLGQHILAGTVQWDGTYITVEYPYHHPTIYRVSISGSTGTVVGTTRLGNRKGSDPTYSYIQGNTVIAPSGTTDKNGKVGYWPYPGGGKYPYKTLKGLHYAYSLAIGSDPKQ